MNQASMESQNDSLILDQFKSLLEEEDHGQQEEAKIQAEREKRQQLLRQLSQKQASEGTNGGYNQAQEDTDEEGE